MTTSPAFVSVDAATDRGLRASVLLFPDAPDNPRADDTNVNKAGGLSSLLPALAEVRIMRHNPVLPPPFLQSDNIAHSKTPLISHMQSSVGVFHGGGKAFCEGGKNVFG